MSKEYIKGILYKYLKWEDCGFNQKACIYDFDLNYIADKLIESDIDYVSELKSEIKKLENELASKTCLPIKPGDIIYTKVTCLDMIQEWKIDKIMISQDMIIVKAYNTRSYDHSTFLMSEYNKTWFTDKNLCM